MRDAAVALLAAVEQSERINDPARVLVIVDGDRLAHHRFLVERGVTALGDGEMGKVQRRGAVARHVRRGDGTERSGGMMDAERSGELRVALDVVGPLRARGASLAITITRFENQYVLADRPSARASRRRAPRRSSNRRRRRCRIRSCIS